ncbi:MAG TPA: hypothetical protein PL045_01635 [Chitinophagaceae bacterium]|nr:hypothetical protein [Chitinophagaceae bacterium]
MKKVITFIAIAVSVSYFCIQDQSGFAFEKPIIKNISLEVYKSNDYSSAIYKDATAKICITITKVSHGSRIIVWNKTFDALQLKQYPSLADALLQKVSINNVFDNKEHLEVLCTISYNSNGGLLEIHNGVLLSKGITDGKLVIQI